MLEAWNTFVAHLAAAAGELWKKMVKQGMVTLKTVQQNVGTLRGTTFLLTSQSAQAAVGQQNKVVTQQELVEGLDKGPATCTHPSCVQGVVTCVSKPVSCYRHSKSFWCWDLLLTWGIGQDFGKEEWLWG